MTVRSARNAICIAVLIVVALATSCSRNRPLDQSLKLEKQGKYSLALDTYRSQIADTPATDKKKLSELYYRVGECLLALDRASEAFSAYNKAVELDERNQMAHLRLGELYLVAGSGDRATEQASAALKSSAPNMDALALLGAAAAANGQTDIARDAFTRVLTAEPGRVKVALSLSDIYQREGDSEKAREVLKKAADAQPHSAAPWLALGRLEEQEGKPTAAEEAYRKAVQAENFVESNLRLAQFLERSARVAEAEQVLQRVDLLRPKLPTALADLQMISGRPSSASEQYLIALRSGLPAIKETDASKRAAAKETRGQLISRLIEADLQSQHGPAGDKPGSVDSARKHLEEFREELDHATVRMLEAEIAMAGDDLPTAKLQAEAAAEMAPDSAAAHYVLGAVKYRMGDAAGARNEWDSALDQDSRFIPARLALAAYTLDLRDLSGAQDYIVPAVREEPANFDALIIFARLLLAQKNYASARIIANRAQVVDGDSAEPHLISGQIALEQKKTGEALLQFQQAVMLEPRSRSAIEGLTNVYRAGTVTRPMLLKMESIATTEPRSATLLEITGRLFADRGWTNDAQRCLQESMQVDPNRPSAAAALAGIFVRNGEMQAATDSASKVSEMQMLLNGVRAQQKDDKQSAIVDYEAAIRAGDKSGVAANNLAWIYAEQGTNLDRALTLAERARELAPGNAGVLDTLGFVHLKRREYSTAVSVLEHAREVASARGADNVSVLGEIKRHLAEAYLRNGQTAEAALVAYKRPSSVRQHR